MNETINKLPSKTAFGLGLAGGLAIMFAIGFFILLGIFLNQGDADNTNKNTTRTSPTAAAPSPSAPTPAPTPQPTGNPPAVTDSDHFQGPKDAKVTLIEFSDIQCPFCQRFHPTVKQLLAEYPNDVRWVYKHFPLDSIHPQARPAAEASECVAEQLGEDGFFAYLDVLFPQQTSMNRDVYIAEAKKLGVNESQFTSCLDGGKYKQRVESDYQQGIQAGVTGTPGSFVNGQVVRGALRYEQIKALVDAELAR